MYFVGIATVSGAGARLQSAGLSPLRRGGRAEVQLPDQVREGDGKVERDTQTDREGLSSLLRGGRAKVQLPDQVRERETERERHKLTEKACHLSVEVDGRSFNSQTR